MLPRRRFDPRGSNKKRTTERQMRPTTFVMTVFIGCGIPSIAACQSAI